MILPNDRWETYQAQWLSPAPSHSIIQFAHDGLCSLKELDAFLELERYVRYLIFEDTRWRPATSTSAMITLLPKDGVRRRFWINGTLIGMRDLLNSNQSKDTAEVREVCVMIERCPPFPTIQSLEDYVKSRMPYENTSPQEIRCLANQINKRFFVVGRMEAREFFLKRQIRSRNRIVIWLRWDLPGETWGYSSWKAYFKQDFSNNVTFVSSRVSCHIHLQSWFRVRLPSPWKYSMLPRQSSPLHRKGITRALTWLQICTDPTLHKLGVIVSIEDDPKTGMPEDIPDGVSMETLNASFNLQPPEIVPGTRLSEIL